MHAIAIDLGTTTLAAALIDLEAGRRITTAGSLNPQRDRFGADVVSRLDAAVRSQDSQDQLCSLIREELWSLVARVCDSGAVSPDQVGLIAIAGNPAMQHLLLGLPVRSLAFPPYRPAYRQGTWAKAEELGWKGTADVYLFPMPGGFVGGDTVAFLYGQLDQGQAGIEQVLPTLSPTLYLDMGTNGEMALIADGVIWATSAAAGPAFEGGNLSCGMAALPGAISTVAIEDERLTLSVIGNGAPRGICGSAAIQTVTLLMQHGLLEPGGRLRDSSEIASNLANRIVRSGQENALVLYRDAARQLLLTQSDIRQIQLAKGALRAGMEVLCQRARIRCQALQDVVLTGSFGAVLRPEWLKSIGIFDEGMVHRTRFVPEGALAGVERSLMAGDGFAAVERLGEKNRIIPLSGTPLFETLFLQHIDFPTP